MSSFFMRFPGGRAKALTLSYDDGVEQDIRLMEIMAKNGLKGTFNLNSGLYAPEGTVYPAGHIHRRMTRRQVSEAFLGSGQEVAAHGLTHPFLEQLPGDRVVYEILRDRENLEEQFGTLVRGMAYPFGTYSDRVVEALRMCGIVYARTTVSTNDFRVPGDWLRMGATCHHNSPELMSLAARFLGESASREPALFYLWGHSYEFDADGNWPLIEEFARVTGGRDDVWYATNIEIYDYVDAYRRLRFSVDGRLAQNPTDRSVWFAREGTVTEVRAGEALRLQG